MGRSIRALWLIGAAAFRADPRDATTALIMTLVDNSGGAFIALGLKALTDSASHQDTRGAIFALLILGGALAVTRVASLAGFVLRNSVRERTTLLVQARLASATAGIPGIEHLERPDYLKEMDLLREEYGLLAWVQQSAVVNLGLLIRVVITLVLLAQVHPLLLMLPLFGVPALILGGRAQRNLHGVWEKVGEPRRLEWDLYRLATSAEAGKEVRVFGLADELIGRHRRIRAEVDREEDRAMLRVAVHTALGWLVFALAFVGAIAFVVSRVMRQEATPGDLVLTLALASQINVQVSGLVEETTWLLRTLKAAGRYVWLLDYAETATQGLTPDPSPPPNALQRGISFEGVHFRYPGTDADVLRDVNLHLPAGTTVAIVGENGAGKTTLVKLLTRFYEPTAGRITVDGVDLRRFSFESWRERTSAGFQDFARFELLARENVGVGDLTHVDDAPAVEAALDRAQARDVVTTLPAGLETQLGRSFDGGAELSGGQWQKLALGRAMMRTVPLLLVLDEPTAALDAQTEHALFERYAGTARRVATANGAITILVSHRFSTVRMADLIVVVADQRIAELGSHEQLVAAGGLYAELYELQARAYR